MEKRQVIKIRLNNDELETMKLPIGLNNEEINTIDNALIIINGCINYIERKDFNINKFIEAVKRENIVIKLTKGRIYVKNIEISIDLLKEKRKEFNNKKEKIIIQKEIKMENKKEIINSSIYTMKNWRNDRLFLAEVGQEITETVFNKVIKEISPYLYKGENLIVGESFKLEGETTKYMTFRKNNGKYYYLGKLTDNKINELIEKEN